MGLEANNFGGNSRRRRSVSANGARIRSCSIRWAQSRAQGGRLARPPLGIALRAGEARASMGISVPGGQVPWRPLLQIFAELSWAAVSTLNSWQHLGKRSMFPRWVRWGWGLQGNRPRLCFLFLKANHHCVSWWPILRSLGSFRWMWLPPPLDPENADFPLSLATLENSASTEGDGVEWVVLGLNLGTLSGCLTFWASSVAQMVIQPTLLPPQGWGSEDQKRVLEGRWHWELSFKLSS